MSSSAHGFILYVLYLLDAGGFRFYSESYKDFSGIVDQIKVFYDFWLENQRI